jgi:regulator of sirC expression with transglutaminase-like and TPR domain
MQTAVNVKGSPALPESQRAALVSLLVDEDPAIYEIVRNKILSYGTAACDWLRPHALSADPVMRRRCQEILNRLARGSGDDRFLDFCLHHGEELDLETAVFLLAQTQYPDANTEAYRALLDNWAGELRERIDFRGGAERILGEINQYLFGELGFTGNPHYGDHPENGYLNRVVDRRTGNPISLCAIYQFVARRLHLPVAGIGLPGHFICRYQSSRAEVYIDAFRGGKFWTKGDCIRYLIQTNHGLQEGYLAPVTPRRMLLRMCANLHQTYSQLEMVEEATRVQRYLVALAK